MRFLQTTLMVALAASATASIWSSKDVYNKWHETELERWLSDHSVPYPTPSDRKDLENLVKSNWNDKIARPYSGWDTKQLQAYLTGKGKEVKKGTEKNKDSLISQVQQSWYETEAQASDAYSSVKDWIFDSWTESQLKAFADKHSIPVPQPRTRDTYLKAVRENYQSAANKVGETAAYPGNWLYASWSDSDLKSWFDERGFPVPQPSKRDQLIASLRRNSRLASLNAKDSYASLSASAESATQSLSDTLLDSWSDSKLKQWADENGIKVPQGSKRNELLALARKHRAQLLGQQASQKAGSAFHAATTSAGNEYAQATQAAYSQGNAVYDTVLNYVDWFGSKLGFIGEEAAASASSLRVAAASSASSAASVASVSASSLSSSLSSIASKSGPSAASEASKSASSAASAASKSASKSAQKAGHGVKESAIKATDYLKEEL